MGNLNTRDIICALNWSGFTPRVGVQFKPTDDTLLNASFAQVFRSSGYNLRNLNPNVAPGPFDQEKRDAYELGLKQEFGGFARINLAGFYNKIKGTQREFQAPFAPFGNFQIITNAADVSIKGIEGELLLKPVSGLTIAGQFGYTIRSARRYPDRPVVGRHGHDAPSRMTSLRAIETGAALFRPTNGGLSLAVDGRGAMLAQVSTPSGDRIVAELPTGAWARSIRGWETGSSSLRPSC